MLVNGECYVYRSQSMCRTIFMSGLISHLATSSRDQQLLKHSTSSITAHTKALSDFYLSIFLSFCQFQSLNFCLFSNFFKRGIHFDKNVQISATVADLTQSDSRTKVDTLTHMHTHTRTHFSLSENCSNYSRTS